MALADIGKGDPAAHLRPTSDRVRESLFNILERGKFGDLVTGARVLDLFAGTGALGLEALSRGADQATFVENGRKSLALLDQNIAKTRTGAETHILRSDATRLGQCPSRHFDLIFMDPPYGRGMGERALNAANSGGWIAPGAAIVWEENSTVTPPPGYAVLDERTYGDTRITLLQAPGA